jgi:hypothetical protein
MDFFLFFYQCKNFVLQLTRLCRGIWHAEIAFDNKGRIHANDMVVHGE